MFDETAGFRWVRGVVRAEMSKQGVTYAELAERFATLGIEENEANLRNKIGRGRFSALFFIQCLELMSQTSLELSMFHDLDMVEFKPSKINWRKTGIKSNDVVADMIADEVESGKYPGHSDE